MADETYAIVETGGKQYRAEKGESLIVERISGEAGDKVTLRPVMYSGGKDVIANGADLEKVKVEASIAEHVRGDKIRVFTYKAKKGSRKRKGHRQELTRIEVTDVKLLARKPAAKAETKPAAETAEAKPAAEKPAAAAKAPAKPKAPAKKPAAKPAAPKKPAAKPAAKKPAAKPAAAKKPAAKKPAAKKSAAKKPAAKKED